MLPTVATIVATRDRPELLRETLAAIAAQDYEGVISTIVVFDQTEPDMSLAVQGTNRPVTIVANARVQGLQGARNTGMQATTSDLIAFCDDDDVWVPSKIRRQVEVLDANPDVHFVGSGVTVVYEGSPSNVFATNHVSHSVTCSAVAFSRRTPRPSSCVVPNSLTRWA